MRAPAIDRAFERRLAALVNAREHGVLQGGLKGVGRNRCACGRTAISRKPCTRSRWDPR